MLHLLTVLVNEFSCVLHPLILQVYVCGIVFVNVPHRADAEKIGNILRMDYGDTLNIVGLYAGQDFSYTVDIVLWICGAFEDHVSDAYKKLSTKRSLKEHAKNNWHKQYKNDLINQNVVKLTKEEAEKLCSEALNDFNEVVG